MYLGLDLSKVSTGWCLWDGEADLPRYGHWRLGSEYTTDGGVFAALHRHMSDLHTIVGFQFIFAEEPIHPAQLTGSTNIRTIRIASGLAAHVHSFSHALGCRAVMEFNVESWRPAFIGRIESDDAKRAARQAKKAGNPKASARGELKRLTVARCQQLGMSPRKDDEADAIGILTHGCLIRGVTPPWLSQEVLRAPLGGRGVTYTAYSPWADAAIVLGQPIGASEYRARRDAMRAISRDVPDPEEFAFRLSLRECDALTTAWQTIGGRRVAEEYVAELRAVGLVECRGACLTAFGIMVRRALMRERA